MEEVVLTGIGVGQRVYKLDHAQRILDLQKANPPRCWSLTDPNYSLVSGKITKNVVPNPANKED